MKNTESLFSLSLLCLLVFFTSLGLSHSAFAMNYQEAEAQWRAIENKQDFQSLHNHYPLHKHHCPGKKEQRRVE